MNYLKAGYSPQQIAGMLSLVHSDTPALRVSHETIYTAIYAMPRGALRKEVVGLVAVSVVRAYEETTPTGEDYGYGQHPSAPT